MENSQRKIIEISPGKYLNIGTKFEPSQEEQLIALLKKYHKAFSWEYIDMQGIHPETCTHHIYTYDCWTIERGGESVVTVLKQLCFF
jgi:hypothetical protein